MRNETPSARGAELGETVRPISHFAVLDGLRGIAAIAVCYRHALARIDVMANSYLAVDFFFVLSGFVIARAYGDRLKTGAMTFYEFVVIRLIRLYPLIFLSSILGFAVLLLRVKFNHEGQLFIPLTESFAVSLFTLPSPFLAHSGFAGLDQAWPINLPAWSLFFELVANIVYAAVATQLNPRKRLVALFLFAIYFIACAALLTSGDVGTDWQSYVFSFARVAFSFTAGLVLYDLYERFNPTAAIVSWLWCPAILLACFFTSSAMAAAIEVLLIFPPLVFVAAHASIGETGKRICLWLGAVSYPLYLLHWSFLKLFKRLLEPLHISDSNMLFVMMGFVIAMLAVADIANRYFDVPVRKQLTARLMPTVRRAFV